MHLCTSRSGKCISPMEHHTSNLSDSILRLHHLEIGSVRPIQMARSCNFADHVLWIGCDVAFLF